jgi:hypothetical protein
VAEVLEKRKKEREMAALPFGDEQQPTWTDTEFEEDTAFENDEGFSPVPDEEIDEV